MFNASNGSMAIAAFCNVMVPEKLAHADPNNLDAKTKQDKSGEFRR
jgi:hypothetical protein